MGLFSFRSFHYTEEQRIPFSLQPQESATFNIRHRCGRVPLVSYDAQTDAIDVVIFSLTPLSVWVTLRNRIQPPSVIQEGTLILRFA